MENHPCFNPAAATLHGRIHLPVAPGCNIQCKFCNRRYDCALELRPGVTSAVLSPKQALHYLREALVELGPVAVVGIAGPGDAFAEPDFTLETLDLVRTHYPEIALCVATNGLNVAPYAAALSAIGVRHVSVTVNATNPTIGAKIVSWVRFGRKVYRGEEGATLLWEQQIKGIQALHENGITIKVNSIVIPGINDNHIVDIAKAVTAIGANVVNPIAFIHVEGSDLADHAAPDHEIMQKVRWEASRHATVVRHCTRCRADAAGLLGKANSPMIDETLRRIAAGPLDPSQDRPNIAVASREGLLVNEHLGKADYFFIYEKTDAGLNCVEQRAVPRAGIGLDRWRNIAGVLGDCRALIVNQAGEPPIAALFEEGIKVIVTEGLVEEALEAAFSGRTCAPVIAKRACDGQRGGGGC
jgi:nitrogen fixation protein NifB